MLIQTSHDIARVAKTQLPTLAKVVADPTRPVSISADLARQFGIATGPPVQVAPHFILRGLDLGALSNDETKALNGVIADATKAIVSDLKAANPVLGGALEGYELVVASIDTYKAWTAPGGPTVAKAGAATVKAMSEAVGALKVIAPGLAQNQFVGTATLLLSLAGQVFKLSAAIGPEPSSEPVPLPDAFRTSGGASAG